MGYVGMRGPKGFGFSAVLVINRVWLLYSNPLYGYVFKKKPLFHHYQKENQQRHFTNYVYGNFTLGSTRELCNYNAGLKQEFDVRTGS